MLKEFELQHHLGGVVVKCGMQIAAAPRPDGRGENQVGKAVAQGAYVAERWYLHSFFHI